MSNVQSTKLKTILFFLTFTCLSVLADTDVVHSISVSTGADYVASSIGDDIREEIPLENRIKVNSAVPVNIRYAFSFTNPKIRNYLPGGYQGVSIGVLNLGSLEPRGFSKASYNIGYPVLTYVFQGGPIHHFNNKFTLDYEWNFGAVFGWRPYSETNKNFNLTVGSHVNAYLNLGLNFRWQLTPHTSVFAGLAVSHFSNGNTSYPNPGVNSFGVRAGMVCTINPTDAAYPEAIPDTVNRKKIVYDVSVWGAPRRRVYRGNEKPVLLPGHYACAGVSFAPMVMLNNWWKAGGSLDLQWDQSSDMKNNYISGVETDDMRFHRPSFMRQSSVGISAHAELQMPLFAVNAGCGYNIIAPTENRGSYQNLTLKVYMGRNLFLNIGYQLRNFHQQSSLMLGAGVSIF